MDATKYRNFLFEDALGSILDGFGRLLGASGTLWGASGTPLGHFLGMSWALLDVSWAPLGVLGRLWHDFGVSGKISGGVQHGFENVWACKFACFCTSWGALAHSVCLLLRHILL